MDRLTLTNAVFGLSLPYFQKLIGMYSFHKAIEYYAEVHLANWNSFIHTLFMPGTMYGIFLGFPGIFKLNSEQATQMRQTIWGSYLVHYSQINLIGAFLTHVLFYYPCKIADEEYKKLGARKSFIKGLVVSFICLFIQEYVGHYLGGDGASRIEAIPNAILYAPIYSAMWWFKLLKIPKNVGRIVHLLDISNHF